MIKFRTALILILTVIIACTGSSTAFADETAVPYSDSHFHSYGIALSTTPRGYLHIVFSVKAKETSAIVGVPIYDIQQQIDGSWVTIADDLDGYMNSDSVSCTFSKNYTGAVSGCRYRVYAKLYIKKYDGSVRTIDFWSQSYTIE